MQKLNRKIKILSPIEKTLREKVRHNSDNPDPDELNRKQREMERDRKITERWSRQFIGKYIVIYNMLGSDGVYFVTHIDESGLLRFQNKKIYPLGKQLDGLGLAWRGHIRLAEPKDLVLARLSGDL